MYAITSAGSPKPPIMQKGTKERLSIRQDCIDVAPRRWLLFSLHLAAPPFWDRLVYFIKIDF